MRQIYFNIGISIFIIILVAYVGILGTQYYKTKSQYEQTKEELLQQKAAQEQRAKAIAEMNVNNLWQEYCNNSLSSKEIQAEMLYYYKLTKSSLANKKTLRAVEEYIRIIKHYNETLNKRKEYCNESIDYTEFAFNPESFDLPSNEMLKVMEQMVKYEEIMKQKLSECENQIISQNIGCQKENEEIVCRRIKNCYNISTQIRQRVQVVNSKDEVIREYQEVFFDLMDLRDYRENYGDS